MRKFDRLKGACLAGLFGVALLCAGVPARAEKNEITLARQFGIGFMPLAIMEYHGLIKKQAAKAGLTNLEVNWKIFNGSDTMVNGLLSGSVDVVSVGIPASLMLWEKTRGTPQEVRMLGPLVSVPMMLITRNPRFKTL
jgi:NitT/TauT family transport system substrate-binding protein